MEAENKNGVLENGSSSLYLKTRNSGQVSFSVRKLWANNFKNKEKI